MELKKVHPVRILNERPTFFKHFVEENVCKFAKLKNTAINSVFCKYLPEIAADFNQTYLSYSVSADKTAFKILNDSLSIRRFIFGPECFFATFSKLHLNIVGYV